MSAVLFSPIFVQVNEHVQPPIELQLRMNIEIGVHFQKSARLDLMQSAAAEVRVGNESVDAGERFEPQKHLERVHLVEKIANGFRDVASLMKISELLFQRIVESHPLHLARRGELAQNGVERFILEQSVE